MKSREELDTFARGIGQGLPFELRWGAYIATESQRSVSAPLKVAATVLIAAVTHPEWAIAAVRTMREAHGFINPFPAEELAAEVERLVSLAYIERSQQ